MSSIAFDVQPINRFAGTSAAIRRPKVNIPIFYIAPLQQLTAVGQEIAFFSYDENHQFRLDDSSLRYYYPPRLGADLSAGFETFRQLDDAADDHLDSLLRTLITHEQKTGQRCEADFVTWRGMMTKVGQLSIAPKRHGKDPAVLRVIQIMAVPFDNFNEYVMAITATGSPN